MSFIVECVNNKDRNIQFSCHYTYFEDLIVLAKRHGWKPQGTVISDLSTEYWKKYEFKNDYKPEEWAYCKTVTDSDAFEWARALRKATKPGDFEPEQISNELVEKFFAFLEQGSFDFAYDD